MAEPVAPVAPEPHHRRPFLARRAAVATPHELASVAGLEILARGGSAVDAMLAANAALGVVYPHMTGAGGDAFWLIHDAATGRQHVLNATGRAGAAATCEAYAVGGAREIAPRGPRAALTVPGAVDGWAEAHARFGRLPFADCLRAAIDLARDGFPVADSTGRYLAAHRDLLEATPATAAAYLRGDGAPPRRGEVLRLPRLADTLEAIAAGGRAVFYEGEIAAAIAAWSERDGGVLTAEDLAAHRSDWVEPARVRYRGRTAVAPPPNSQGFAGLQILGMLEHVDVAALAGDPAGYVDAVVRATALAFEDRDRHLCDPDFGDIPLERLLDPAYLAERAALLSPDAAPAAPLAAPRAAGDTTFSCAVDADGNAAAVIQSIYQEWGSGVVAGDTGVLLQNRGCFFSLDPGHPNRLAPGRRTAHTLTAAMLIGKRGPELVYGAMGGEGQPQTQAAIATRVVDHGLSVQEAVDAPRWLLGRTWGEEHRGLRLEARFGADVASALAARGHENVGLVEDWTDVMGHAQAIQIRRDHLEAAADPRGDGAALGL
jgi:gamma-glutamyltranspeptidase/glutathione hydrolase